MEQEKYKEKFNRSNNFLKLLGARLVELENGYAKVELITDERHMNVNGTVHGGIMLALADTAAGAASKSCGRSSVTLEGKMNFLHPACVNGECLQAIARVIHGGRRTGVFECRIQNNQGRLLAVGLYTMFMLEQDLM